MASHASYNRNSTMILKRRRTVLYALIAFLCAVSLWLTYQWFEGRYVRAFSDRTALFAGDALSLPKELAGPGPIRLVHFWDPACPCSVGNQQHLAELTERFSSDAADQPGVKFYSVQKPGSQGRLPSALSKITPLTHLPGAEHISSSPAVAIFDRQGQLAYFGPYSEGLTCNSSNSFIEPILVALLDNRSVSATHSMAVGCYCPWSSGAKADQ
jgi:hypothetical protein